MGFSCQQGDMDAIFRLSRTIFEEIVIDNPDDLTEYEAYSSATAHGARFRSRAPSALWPRWRAPGGKTRSA